jgi:hypothetical protein
MPQSVSLDATLITRHSATDNPCPATAEKVSRPCVYFLIITLLAAPTAVIELSPSERPGYWWLAAMIGATERMGAFHLTIVISPVT